MKQFYDHLHDQGFQRDKDDDVDEYNSVSQDDGNDVNHFNVEPYVDNSCEKKQKM